MSLWWWPVFFMVSIEFIEEWHWAGCSVAVAIVVCGLVVECVLSGWRPSALILPITILVLCSMAALLTVEVSSHDHF